MPSNPFKRRPSAASNQGITIAANSSASGSFKPNGGPRINASTRLALPPDSEYRTSLIMPHLTRRFTLLRAPDGSMVTPDAMRAHLRAQRARARAAGVSGNQTFLTEEEENEIIDQLRRQTRMESQTEEDLDQSQSRDRFGEGSDGFGGTDGFSGTDGFGGWGSSSPSLNTSSRIDSKVVDSFSSLTHSSSAGNVQEPTIGGFFSGRSSARDNAYITEVEKSRAARGRENTNEYAAPTDGRELAQVEEEEDEVDSEEAMPGDFLVAEKRASKHMSEEAKLEQKEGLAPPLPQGNSYRHSQLLTSLTPDAFRRVSTALEEVYGMVASSTVDEGTEDSTDQKEPTIGEEEREIVQEPYHRPSLESDRHSFTSAQSEVMSISPKNALQSPPALNYQGISAATMVNSDSTSTLIPSSSSARAAAPLQDVIPNWTSETIPLELTPPRSKQSIVSVDPANGRIKRGPAEPHASTYNLDDSDAQKSLISTYNTQMGSNPLQTGFSSAGQGTASATAAGVAAAAYVANHQRQQRTLADGPSMEPSSSPVTSQIVKGPAVESGPRSPTVRSPSAAANAVLSADAIAARSPRYFPSTHGQSMQKYADGFRAPSTPNGSSSSSGHALDALYPTSSATLPASNNILASSATLQRSIDDSQTSGQESHDAGNYQSRDAALSLSEEADEGEEDEDQDVWAKVARNTAPTMKSSGRSADTLASSSQFNDAGISLDRLHEIQNTLVRSASSKNQSQPLAFDDMQRSYDSNSGSLPPPLPLNSLDSTMNQNSHNRSFSSSGSVGSGNVSQEKLEKARERARMIAERQQQQQQQQQQSHSAFPSLVGSMGNLDKALPPDGITPDMTSEPFPSRNSVGEKSTRDVVGGSPQQPAAPVSRLNQYVSPARSQVMYDVTTSHRPTSPPPRGHKTSLTNLPSLQDLSMGSNGPFTIGGDSSRNSVSLASMVEATTRAHDQLANGNDYTSPLLHAPPQAIPEESAVQPSSAVEEYEDHQIEDGFGGYVTETRPRQSKSQDTPYSLSRDIMPGQPQYDDTVGLASPRSPLSNEHSESGARMESASSYSRQSGGHDASFNENLLDDVAAQAQAATLALKGDVPSRPQLPARTKSLSRGGKKKLSKAISQPQLLSTTQRLEHAEEVPKIDRTLSRKEGKRQHSYASLQQQKNTLAETRQASAPVIRTVTPTPGLAINATRSPSSATTLSPTTDYRSEMRSGSKIGHRRKSSSFGHRGQLENEDGPLATPPLSAPLLQTSASPNSPSSDRSQGGLGRFMTRLRSKKQPDGAAFVSPYPMGNSAAVKSSPALSGFNTPSSGSNRSPVFVTPMEDMSNMPGSATQDGNSPRRLPMPSTGANSLAGLFGSDTMPLPPRTSSTRNGPQGQSGVANLGSPALIQESWSAKKVEDSSIAAPTSVLETNPSARQDTTKSARDTVVRRTIIVSTIDTDERRRSAAPARKPSLRKPVPGDDGSKTNAANSNLSNGMPRASSSTSSELSNPNRDTAAAASGPEAFASMHRRKQSQEVKSNSMPRNVYDSVASGLAPPSPGASRRVSNTNSDYGTSVYDMYFDDASDARHSRGVPTANASMRQSVVDGNGAARHIEVTERADGSVVWQVIAGLADRSSTYSNSVLGFNHSRTTSRDSQFSYLNQSDILSSPISSSRGYDSLANEDGRSLFARTKGRPRQSLSYDEDIVPPLPNLRGLNEGPLSKMASPLEFDMANTPGAAATRIVYTSDAELANMLDSLAGPDKSSAKFEFQRMANADGSTRPMSTWADYEPTKGEGLQAAATTTNGFEAINGDSKERIRIEAEIYSLLQRDGHPPQVAATVAKQHANQGRSSTTINVTRSSM